MVETRRDRRRKQRPRLNDAVTRFLPYIHLWSNRGEIIGMPTPPVHYLALARNFEQVNHWCFQHGVRGRSVRPVMNMADARGLGQFSLIVFSGWMDTATDEKMRAGDYLMQTASQMFFVDTHDPRTNGQGIITDWVRRSDAVRRATLR